MCNSPLMFDLLGEEISGEHDSEPVQLPNGCTLTIWKDYGNKWFYEATTSCGKKFVGAHNTRCEAFDRAIEELADYIN